MSCFYLPTACRLYFIKYKTDYLDLVSRPKRDLVVDRYSV